MSLFEAVRASVQAGEVPERALGLVALAEAYARQIDEGACPECEAKAGLVDLGPKLQAALQGLGLAVVLPGATGTSKAPAPAGQGTPADMLAALRAERERRSG